jgi:Fe-S cluster biosynthesis and repair protein YggX
MARMVQCAKLGQELPGLEKQPFSGPLGERIYENISADAYALWLPHMTTIINHYGLNPADPETRALLRNEMTIFFFGDPNAETSATTGDLRPETVREA